MALVLLGYSSSPRSAEHTRAESLTVSPGLPDTVPWPISYPVKITSTFGEYRKNHFHAGIDLSTYGSSGHALTAVAPCTVWRVRVDPRGYGNTLSLRLDSGHIVTLAHMKRFAAPVQACVRRMQESTGCCLVDFYPEPGEVRFAQGEVVGTSGSSGAGPAHVHMEVWASEEEAVNPLLHWYSVPDSVAPAFYRLVLSPLSANALVNGRSRPTSIRVRKQTGTTQWDALTTPQVCGEIGLAVRAADRVNSGGDRVGLYRLRTQVDGEEVFRREYAAFAADQLTLIDLVYDAELLRRGFGRCERLYRLPGDHLRFHENSPGDGVLRAGLGGLDYGMHTVDIFLEDAAQNCSRLTLPLLVNLPPEVAGIGWSSPDTVSVTITDEEPDACVASFTVKTRGRWIARESQSLGGGRWRVVRPDSGVLLSVTVKDRLGASSRPFYSGDALPREGTMALRTEYELLDGYARITLHAAGDLAHPPQAFVAPGDMGFSRATMWAHTERTYGMELLLFPQAAPGFRVVFMADGIEGSTGSTEVFVPLAPLAMEGRSEVRSEDGRAWVVSESDAVFQDVYLNVSTRPLPRPDNGLEAVSAGYEFGPQTTLLKHDVAITIALPDTEESPEGIGIFAWGGGVDYRIIRSAFNRELHAFVGSTRDLGVFTLLRDPHPPHVSTGLSQGAVIRRQPITIRGSVSDRGSGVDPESVQMYVDGEPVPACPDGPRAWVHRSSVTLAPGDHLVTLVARDRVGNLASAETTVQVR